MKDNLPLSSLIPHPSSLIPFGPVVPGVRIGASFSCGRVVRADEIATASGRGTGVAGRCGIADSANP